MMYANAIKKKATFDIKKISKEIMSTKQNGVTGDFSFDEKGAAIRGIIFKQVRNGKLEEY